MCNFQFTADQSYLFPVELMHCGLLHGIEGLLSIDDIHNEVPLLVDSDCKCQRTEELQDYIDYEGNRD